jgi:phage-related protein
VINFNGRIRKVKIYGQDFWLFFNKQNAKVQDRILWVIRLVQEMERVPEKYLKHMEGCDGVYEIRVSSGSNIFRIFCFFDRDQLVILLNGFQKKTQKTPASEIAKAKKLKSQYYEDQKE